jgi:hypothetical protein
MYYLHTGLINCSTGTSIRMRGPDCTALGSQWGSSYHELRTLLPTNKSYQVRLASVKPRTSCRHVRHNFIAPVKVKSRSSVLPLSHDRMTKVVDQPVVLHINTMPREGSRYPLYSPSLTAAVNDGEYGMSGSVGIYVGKCRNIWNVAESAALPDIPWPFGG